MNEQIVVTKVFPANDWLQWLTKFSNLVANKQYQRLDYRLWKNINKPTDGILINLVKHTVGPVIDIYNGQILTSVYSTDNSLGDFLFKNMFNQEERAMAYNDEIAASATGALATTTIDAAKIANVSALPNSYDGISNSLSVKSSDWSYVSDTCTAEKINGTIGTTASSWIDVDLSSRPTFADVERMIDKRLNKNEKEKENEKMKGFNFDFGPCTGDQVRMSMYGLAVKNAAGTYVSYNPTSGEIIDVDVLNFDGAKFMYKIPVAIKDIAVGDIIVHNRKPMFVIALPTEGATAITCVDVCAGEQKQVIPTVNMFGFNFVTKIVSFFNTVGNNAPTPDAPFGNMLPIMLMNEGTDKIDPMMMMFMMGGKIDMNNPMMMYCMIKDNKDSDMLPLLFMAQNK